MDLFREALSQHAADTKVLLKVTDFFTSLYRVIMIDFPDSGYLETRDGAEVMAIVDDKLEKLSTQNDLRETLVILRELVKDFLTLGESQLAKELICELDEIVSSYLHHEGASSNSQT